MNAVNFAKTLPRLVLATPFRLFAVYVSLVLRCRCRRFYLRQLRHAWTFLDHEAEASVQTDFDFLAARYREGGLPALVNAHLRAFRASE